MASDKTKEALKGIGLGIGTGMIGPAISMWKNKQEAVDKGMEEVDALPLVDPMQLDFLDMLKREKRAVESGFTTDFQVAKDLNQEMLAGGLSVAESVASTNPALGLSMVEQVTRGYSTGINQALGTISTRGFGLTASMGDLINRVAQRKLDVTTYKTAQHLGMAVDDLKTFKQNAMQIGTSIGSALTGMPMGGGGSSNTGYTPPSFVGRSGAYDMSGMNNNIQTEPLMSNQSSWGLNEPDIPMQPWMSNHSSWGLNENDFLRYLGD